MKVVALVSGGKDSCYAMFACQQHGHEIVALGNLLPVQDETDELDSYMFQTVGHQLIDVYAECMALPLYRKRITGGSKNQALVYEETDGDEVEDLFLLLSYIKQQIPDLQAVSSGAIASDYQRTRVERVCARLGLVSLAYLWQQPQAPLLQEMIDSGIEAILVKVAAAGLTPEKHLGASLQKMQPILHKLRPMFGINVCGEGGEYETLTLDCPLFTRRKIVLDAFDIVKIQEDSMAPVGYLHPTAFHTEPKTSIDIRDNNTSSDASTLEQTAAEGRIIEVPDDFHHFVLPSPPREKTAEERFRDLYVVDVVETSRVDNGYLTISASVKGPNSSFSQDEQTTNAVHAALSAIYQRLEQLFGTNSKSMNSVFVHLYVPSMACFAAANAAYATYLPAVNPPARATVQLAGNADVALIAEVLFADLNKSTQQVLHVQSISKWAPSCIGPYSQAVRCGNFVMFAGQIPLDPGSMTIEESSVEGQCRLSLNHCQAVAIAMKVDLTKSMGWCTIYCSESVGAAGLDTADRCIKEFLSGATFCLDSKDSDSDDERDSYVDEYLRPPQTEQRHQDTQLTFIVVPELPRGALVEIQPVACVFSSNGDSEEEVIVVSECTTSDGIDIRMKAFINPGKQARAQAWIERTTADNPKNIDAISVYALKSAFEEALSFIDLKLEPHGFENMSVVNGKAFLSKGAYCLLGDRSLGQEYNITMIPVSCLAVGSASTETDFFLIELLALQK